MGSALRLFAMTVEHLIMSLIENFHLSHTLSGLRPESATSV